MVAASKMTTGVALAPHSFVGLFRLLLFFFPEDLRKAYSEAVYVLVAKCAIAVRPGRIQHELRTCRNVTALPPKSKQL